MNITNSAIQESDSDLLKAFLDPNSRNAAFDRIMITYQEKIYYHIRRIVIDHDDANDVIQNTFIKAFHGLEKFRADSKLSTWLYRIATNEAITFINKRKKIAGVSLDDLENQLPTVLQHDQLFSGDEIEAKLQAAISSLPEKQKLVFLLKYYEGKKYDEISEITGSSIGGLKASYHHAVKKIEKYISGLNL